MIRTLLAALPLMAVLSCSAPEPAPQIDVRDAWARATAAGQSSGAIYATIVNRGGADALTGVATPRADSAMIYSTQTANGVARMRMADRLAIPAGETIALAPGGTHIMLGGLSAPLVAGEPMSIALSFAKSGEREVRVTIVAPGSR